MKRLLLDTEALVWWDANELRLDGNARARIQNAAEVYVSAASAWEITIKPALGKLRTTRRPARRWRTPVSMNCPSVSSTPTPSVRSPRITATRSIVSFWPWPESRA